MEASPVTIGERVEALSRAHPERPAVVVVSPSRDESALTWADLHERSVTVAAGLHDQGVRSGDLVGTEVGDRVDHTVVVLACWLLGTTVIPLRPSMTRHERTQLLASAPLDVLITRDRRDVQVDRRRPARPNGSSSDGKPRSGHLTGGTTGQPGVVLRERPWVFDGRAPLTEEDLCLGYRPGQVQMVVLPLHQAGFTSVFKGLAFGHTIVMPDRFTPSAFFDAIQRYRVQIVRLVPSIMRLALEDPRVGRYDLSSLEVVHHGSAFCPEKVKRAWLDLVPPQRLYEGYSGTERVGTVWIRGDEWLDHPGSVGMPGRSIPGGPRNAEVRILDDGGDHCPIGSVGNVYMRDPRIGGPPRFLGRPRPVPTNDGFVSLGDLGYIGSDGYLYLVDRRADMFKVGGESVYPSEVESALLEHDDVQDVAVVSRPHDLTQCSVHAVVVPRDLDRPPPIVVLDGHCRARLSTYKVPMSYEFVDELPRSDSGKLVRREL